jgi:hypothetical protein
MTNDELRMNSIFKIIYLRSQIRVMSWIYNCRLDPFDMGIANNDCLF